MSIKEDLHRLVDELPESMYISARRQLERLRNVDEDPYYVALMNLPIDDEPDTPEEAAYDEEGWQAYLRGEGRDWEDVKKDLFP